MSRITRATDKHPAKIKNRRFKRHWEVIEGAVVDALKNHPDYVTEKGRSRITASVTKRVLGNLRSAGLLADGRSKERL